MTRPTTDTATPGANDRYLLAKAGEGQLAFGSPHLFKATASDTADDSISWSWRWRP